MIKKYIILTKMVLYLSCGIIIDTSDETYIYTYILKNKTGTLIEITSDFGRTELVPNNGTFECSYSTSPSIPTGLCGGFLEIRIPNTNQGYRCHGSIVHVEGLCFIEDAKIFTRLDKEKTIFSEIDTRVYEYTLTPDLLENAFELPK
ncbi:hypothetical protein FVB32_09080 [Flagellimonas hymeniacidonis]|uniref:Uncharacterized protein n=1 Tax=Flagellimonas hymeniacidonis TaxID=2603628 RepID=A0A5C8V0A8_9FLAO|nr:hypothetical protein [Flagellimonas hymeniacidonis]TXN34746.1 hypothetical protein FVB32_09080 [Flagellimonas hymeniacidonis]